jgi:hypothetical protein
VRFRGVVDIKKKGPKRPPKGQKTRNTIKGIGVCVGGDASMMNGVMGSILQHDSGSVIVCTKEQCSLQDRVIPQVNLKCI